MAIGLPTIVLGLGALLVIYGIFVRGDKKDASNVALLVGGLFLVVGWFAGGTAGLTAGGITTGGIITTPVTPVVSAKCPDVTVTGSSAIRNIANTSTDYMASSIAYTKANSPDVIATGTATAGASLSYASTNLVCTGDMFANGVQLYALPAAGLASTKSEVLKFDGGTSVQKVLQAYRYANLTIIMRDTTLVNTSDATAASAADGVINEAAATAMAQGGTRTGYVDISEATSNVAFGSPQGLLFAWDNVASAVFSPKGFTFEPVSGNYRLSEVACSTYPNGASQWSADRCWTGSAITSSTGLIRYSWTLTADTGEPVAASDPILYIHPIEYGQNRDSKIILDTHDSGGTVFGPAAMSVTWDNS